VKATAKRLMASGAKNVLVLVALVLGYLALIGILSLVRGQTCDRLLTQRAATLESGHDSPGPGYVHVRGVGTDRSMLQDYLEADAAMMEAECER
jgi:hypothetical protein